MIQIIGLGLVVATLFVVVRYIYENNWDYNLSVEIQVEHKEIYEGEKNIFKEIVCNEKRLPLNMLMVKFQADRNLIFEDHEGAATTDRFYRNDVFQINGYEKITRTLSLVANKRGYYSVDTIDLVGTDIFFSKRFYGELKADLGFYVFPKPYYSEKFVQSLKQLNGDVITKRHLIEDPFEYRGIREYEPHDDMRMINWKASAKSGKWMVNQRDYTTTQSVRIFINVDDKGILKREKGVEDCFRIAAGLCTNFLNQGIQVSCYCNGVSGRENMPVSIDASAGKGQLLRILRTLAIVDLQKPTAPFDDTFRERLLQEDNNVVTCVIAPNQYEDFTELLLDYIQAGGDFMWFYPVENEPDKGLPEELRKHVIYLDME